MLIPLTAMQRWRTAKLCHTADYPLIESARGKNELAVRVGHIELTEHVVDRTIAECHVFIRQAM